eukprot:gnl/TRDRNA2_/TRDRNA2_207672_c0_seq1.p3 gnl/TRDRNA2_/TRDRNA2_207672_c0~~gnl/TRDRNA2_/TRDRNA2_207672_c0_seq1.p3  ORF type:complete len:179 (+),score=16.89 gnl/TRDRNA2_/TRDRNA2_207672_c0_seq1:380-916(+)
MPSSSSMTVRIVEPQRAVRQWAMKTANGTTAHVQISVLVHRHCHLFAESMLLPPRPQQQQRNLHESSSAVNVFLQAMTIVLKITFAYSGQKKLVQVLRTTSLEMQGLPRVLKTTCTFPWTVRMQYVGLQTMDVCYFIHSPAHNQYLRVAALEQRLVIDVGIVVRTFFFSVDFCLSLSS